MIENISDIVDRAMSCTEEGITISEISKEGEPLVYVNGGFERMTGYSREEILGRNCRFLQGTDTNKDEVAKIRHAIQTGQNCTVEILNYKKNGEKFWNRLSIAPVSLPADSAQYYVGIQCDITSHVIAEDKLRQYCQELEEKNDRISETLKNFDQTLGRAFYNATSSSKKLAEKGISEDEDLIKTMESLKEATESANDLILGIRSAIANFGGAQNLHNIDLVSFTAVRKHKSSK